MHFGPSLCHLLDLFLDQGPKVYGAVKRLRNRITGCLAPPQNSVKKADLRCGPSDCEPYCTSFICSLKQSKTELCGAHAIQSRFSLRSA